jgi:hypothetical protein
MDRLTLEALKRIMERVHPRNSDPVQVRSDWHQVMGWIDEAAHDLDDLDTLGTDDRRLLSRWTPSPIERHAAGTYALFESGAPLVLGATA